MWCGTMQLSWPTAPRLKSQPARNETNILPNWAHVGRRAANGRAERAAATLRPGYPKPRLPSGWALIAPMSAGWNWASEIQQS